MKLPFSFQTLACALGFCLAANSAHALDILPLGDSITYGYINPSEQGSNGYRAQLYSDLNKDVTFVGSQTDGNLPQPNNEGHNGYTIEEIDQGLKGVPTGSRASGANNSNNGGHWLDGGNGTNRPAITPDVVLLGIGTNNATDGQPVVVMEANLKQLLADLKADLPNAQIFVGSVPPRNDDPAREAVQQQYNAAIPAIVAAAGPKFHFVNIHDAINFSNISGTDGVHPTRTGYDKIGDTWYQALVSTGVVSGSGLSP